MSETGKTILYAASVQPLTDDRTYALARQCVSQRRRDKADRLRFPADRRLSLGAELLLRFALRAAGLTGPFPAFSYSPLGKPFLPDAGIHFSLSHSGEYALCAVSDLEVGCDVEKLRPMTMKLARRFFAPEEADALAAIPDAEAQNVRFFRYWTLKESFQKAVGMGLHLPLKDFCIRIGEEITVEQHVKDASFSFGEFEDLPGYRCAFCAEGKNGEADFQISDVRRVLEVLAGDPFRESDSESIALRPSTW